jgi:hypothetical protein
MLKTVWNSNIAAILGVNVITIPSVVSVVSSGKEGID